MRRFFNIMYIFINYFLSSYVFFLPLMFLASLYMILFFLICVSASDKQNKLRRLVAFGDLHGDIKQCHSILQLANITDLSGRWIAGNSIVVQLGDIADRGPHYHEIYDLFASLERQAKAAGGEFTFVIGNHERMNLIGIFSYVNINVVKVFGGIRKYAAAFGPRGPYGSYILQHSICLVREGIVFVHGGILPMFAAKGVDKLNNMFRRDFYCSGNCSAPDGANGGGSLSKGKEINDSGERSLFDTSVSPLWERSLIIESFYNNCTLLTESLRLLSESEVAAGRSQVHTMVVGHTPLMNGSIVVLCGGRLVGADVGLSRAMNIIGGHLAYVEFVSDEQSPSRRIAVPQYPLGKTWRRNASSMLNRKLPLSPSMNGIRRKRGKRAGVNKYPWSFISVGGFVLYCIVPLFVFFFFIRWKMRNRTRRFMRNCHYV